jgi:lipid-binding SYLF domain-containing protein
MKRITTAVAACLLAGTVATGAVRAQREEATTVDGATEVLQALSALSVKAIPPALLQDAKGVAILPNVVKAGLIVGGRFGRGVVLVRCSEGGWYNPIFITLAGGGVGWQAGIQSTDLVLVFKTRSSLDRILRGKGKLTLGADAGVAAGPVGRQAEASTDTQLKAEIYSYSRSRGLFAGVSLEGAALLVDRDTNEAFYGVRGGKPEDVLALHGVPVPAAAERLKAQLAVMSAPPPPPPVIIYPPQSPAPPLVPPPAPPAPPAPGLRPR